MSARTLLTVVLFTSTTLLSGCGTSDYEAPMQKRLGEAQLSTPFTVLYGASKISGTPISIRIPQGMLPYDEGSKHPEDGDKIDPRRVQPPFMKLPGFKLCYEKHETSPDSQKLPVYCYLAASPIKTGESTTVMAKVLDTLKQQQELTVPGGWEDVSVKTPTGTDLAWKKIHVTGSQFFDTNSAGGDQEEFKKMPGTFDLWAHRAQGWLVLIGWRESDAIAGTSKLSELQPLTAGTVEIGSPQEAAPAQ